MTDLLSAADPEPPVGTVVETADGERWWRDATHMGSPCNWFHWRELSNADRHDPESWTKVAGNYGPVRVVWRRDVCDQVPEHLDDVGPGWAPILERLHAQLLKAVPGYTVGDIKEKFGGLRVHLDFDEHDLGDGYPAGVGDMIEAAEHESRRTCEFCGKPGVPRPGGWVKTLCDGCHGRRR